MEKYYSISEISKLTGLDRKRINDYKDVIPADHSSERGGYYSSKNGIAYYSNPYKEYNEKSVEKFVIVSMLTELNIKRERIKEIVSSPNYDSYTVLQEVIENAKKEIAKLENIVLVSEQLRNLGIEDSKYSLFCASSVDDLAKIIREQMNTPYYKQIEKLFEKLSDKESNEIFNCVFNLAKLKDLDETSSKVDKKVSSIEKRLTDKYHIEGDKFLVNVAFNFIANGPLSKIVNKEYGEESSRFIFFAILAHYFKDVLNTAEKLFSDDNDISEEDIEGYLTKSFYSIIDCFYTKLKGYIGNAAKETMLNSPKQFELELIGNKNYEADEYETYIYSLAIKALKKYNDDNFLKEVDTNV